MAKGDGSITKVKPGVWRVCISRGIDPVTKKQVKVQQTVHGTKAEARKVRDKIRADLDGGLVVGAKKMTFGEFADTWAKRRKESGEYAENTIKADATNLNPSNFSRWWRAFTKENGFEGLCFHELRHTQATQLLAHGVDVKTVSSRLGHAKASITLDMYTHAVPQNDQAAANLVGKIFAPNAGENEKKESQRLSA